VVRIRTDCDQDVVVIDVQVNADGAACHTGRATCFYREVGSTTVRSRQLTTPGCSTRTTFMAAEDHCASL
jgi:hypothetical protein